MLRGKGMVCAKASGHALELAQPLTVLQALSFLLPVLATGM